VLTEIRPWLGGVAVEAGISPGTPGVGMAATVGTAAASGTSAPVGIASVAMAAGASTGVGAGWTGPRFHSMKSRVATASQAISRKERVWFMGRLRAPAWGRGRARGLGQESEAGRTDAPGVAGIVPGGGAGFNDRARSSSCISCARRSSDESWLAPGWAIST